MAPDAQGPWRKVLGGSDDGFPFPGGHHSHQEDTRSEQGNARGFGCVRNKVKCGETDPVNVNEKVSHLGKRKVSHPKFKKRVVQVFFLPVSVFRSLNR